MFAQSVKLTPDGDKVLALVPSADPTGPGEVRVWDAVTGAALLLLPGRSPSCGGCQAAAFALSPDGKTVAVLSQRLHDDPQSEVSLFDLLTGERRLLLEAPLPQYGEVRFSPDGARLAAVFVSYGYDGKPQVMQATLWDASGALVGTFEQPVSGDAQRDPHMWHGDAPVVAKLYGDRIELVTISTGELLHTLPAPPEPNAYPYLLYANAANTRLLGLEASATLWDLETDSLLTTGKAAYLVSGFSPDGRYALLYDGVALKLSNPDTLKPEKTLVSGEVVPLELTSTATYIDSKHYAVAGTARFGDDAPVPFEGEVVGHESEVYVQMSPPRPAELTASFTYQGREWELLSGPPFATASLFTAVGENTYALEYGFDLAKVP